jgi:thiosulfate/3-mercaptopyruvate sulfurtransferase
VNEAAPTTNDDRSETGEPPGVVVEPGWLEARLGSSELRIVDLRDAEAYAESHIPGAVRLELSRLGTSRPGRDNVLLSPDAFSDLMETLGISTGDTVVAYDDQWGLAAARLLWALHHYGHTAVAVLDGGWDGWTEEERPTAGGETRTERGRFTAVPREDVAATGAWIAERASNGSLALLDTRTRKEFDDGHIPGARWWDWFTAVPPGEWTVARDLEELRAEWSALGAGREQEIVVYCRSGMRAAHTYMVLKHAGYPRVRLYDGSWQDWSTSGGEVERA